MKNLAIVSQRQEQRLFSLPQMRQAVHILQLPVLELKMHIEQEIASNPLLEECSISEAKAEDTKGAGFLEREIREAQNLAASRLSLWDELFRQLRMAGLDREDMAIGARIIVNIDPEGYLKVNLQEIADELVKGNLKKVEEVLLVIQTFEPAGVASRSIQECLLIQLRLGNKGDSLAAEVVKNHWEAFVKRRYAQLSKALKCPLEQIEEVAREISKLNPRPTSAYGHFEAVKAFPDAVLTASEEGYKVSIDEGRLPAIRINSKYCSMLQEKNISEEAKRFIRDKLNSAKWLIEAINQRKKTLEKVVQYIVEAQKEFLEEGESCLKPLTLQEVAEKTQLHPSTISRVTARKYLQTPMGMYRLKDFFSTAIGRDNIDAGIKSAWSAEAVKLEIRDLITAEGKASPLGDGEIVSRLSEKGIKIARRTVAKYRQGMGILSSHIRRQYTG